MAARPLIGILPSFDLEKNMTGLRSEYAFGLAEVGGVPVILPVPETTVPEGQWLDWLDHLDGLLVSGGPDIDPQHFGETPLRALGAITPQRDRFELAITKLALARDLPVLGICRGIQTLAVAAGGTLWQDLPSQMPASIKHRQDAPYWHVTHEMRALPGSGIASCHGAETFMVNSFHHQAVKDIPEGFVATAFAPDGVVEAMESAKHRRAFGVQWHPEGIWGRDRLHLGVFRHLVEACR
jgi:putative glutamine amidotransferase